MEQSAKKISKLRRPFVIAGAACGALLSVWYLSTNFGRTQLVPDPVWAKFVNIAMLMFSSIYISNLLRHLVELILRKTRPGK